MQLADLLIHVPEQLSAAERSALEEELRGLDGVVAPRFNPTTPHLLLVAYNPAVIRSRRLLDEVRTLGYGARGVGL